MRSRRILLSVLAVLLAAFVLAALLAARRLARTVEAETDPERARLSRTKRLSFSPLPLPASRLVSTGDGSILSAALVGGDLWTGGGSGLTDGRSRFDPASGLPSLRVAAVASWRSDVVFALEAGGWGRIGPSGPEEATSEYGRLEVRSLAETPAGELLVGAKQGLFAAPYGAGELTRLSSDPVRALAFLGAGLVAAGGESGLRIVSQDGVPSRAVVTPDPWIDALGFDGKILWAATPVGAALGDPLAVPARLARHPRGTDATRGVLCRGTWWALAEGGRVASLGADGGRHDEPVPEPLRRLLVAGDDLLGETAAGLVRKDLSGGWTTVRRRSPDSLPAPHVSALAARGPDLILGFFDGGLAMGTPGPVGQNFSVRSITGSAVWGVNALFSSGNTFWAATLRGVFRVSGERIDAVDGPGAAFSLASTPGGIAAGYGQGVLLPGRRLLSAFHGLPGNQATALAAAQGTDALWVGTPTGLGRIERTKVTLRILPGEGKLPNPWVTGLLDTGNRLIVATWGGGVTARTSEGAAERWTPFPETDRLRVNAGALLAGPDGRLWIGTQGEGLWRTDAAQRRFEKVALPLPSPNVFSLALFPADRPDSLFVGTDQGLIRIPLGYEARSPEAP